MLIQNILGGLLVGGYMGVVLGPVAISGARLRLAYGWRYAIFIALGGSAGDLLIAVSSVTASGLLSQRFHTIFAFFQSHLAQGLGLIALGLLTLVPIPAPKQPEAGGCHCHRLYP